MKSFQASPNYIHRKITGLDVLISVGENIADFNGYVQLNASAALLWDALREPRTAAELEQLLTERFGITREQAQADAADFLELLTSRGMAKEC